MSSHLAARPYTRDFPARAWTALLIGAMHAIPISALIIGTDASDWLLFAVIYPFQGAIGVGMGLHRYFAHKSFSTSRIFQFLLALCSASTFGSPMRFAGKHRLHHQHADRKDDPHTPVHGFWWCWFGSHLDCKYTEEEILERVPDLSRYPELVWLYRYWMAPGLALCLILFLIGRRRFETNDNSTNNFIVTIFLAGEGWHNNHHRYPYSARAGFCWWEIDIIYWIICFFELFGLVWDVRRPPEHARRMTLLPRSRKAV